MNRLLTWFLPKWDPILEKRVEPPVNRMDLSEAASHRDRLKETKYTPSRRS